MRNLLFPKGFQIAGWILFVPAVIMAILFGFNFCSINDLYSMSGLAETIVNDAIIIGIALGALFIVCSKEPCEDEMTRAIRLSSLLNALYIYVILLITSTIIINGLEFLWFMTANLVLFPIVYVVIFRLEMHRYYKMTENEE